MVHPAEPVRRSKLLSLAALTILHLFAQAAAKSDAAAQVRRADAAIASAASQDVALLAPTTLAQAVREFGAAETALKNKKYAEASAAAERAIKFVEKASSVATRTRDLLKGTVALRSSVTELDSSLVSRLTGAALVSYQKTETGTRKSADSVGRTALGGCCSAKHVSTASGDVLGEHCHRKAIHSTDLAL